MLLLYGTHTLFYWKKYKCACFQTEDVVSVDSLLIFHWRLQKKTNTMYRFGKGEVTVTTFIVTKIT